MTLSGNAFDHNTLASLTRQAAPRVVSAIKKAAARTGVDFAYLMQKASAESSFDAKAKSRGSSATGLFQFIDSTWLSMVRDFGHKYGMGQYADHIDSNGHVDDPALKKEILALRNNPEKASFMAAEFASENETYLRQHLDSGAAIGPTELYLAHFLGAGSATAFIKAKEDNPLSMAADLFPKAARANRNVFYDPATGQPRTLAGVYDFFAKKFGDSGATSVAAVQQDMKEPVFMPVRKAPVMPDTDGLQRQMAMDNALLDVLMPSGENNAPQRLLRMDEGNHRRPMPAQIMSTLVRNPAELMLIARADRIGRERDNHPHYND